MEVREEIWSCRKKQSFVYVAKILFMLIVSWPWEWARASPFDKWVKLNQCFFKLDWGCVFLHLPIFFSHLHKFSYFQKYPSVIFRIT